MTRFQELDEFLDREYSIDYWSDDAILFAQKLVHQCDNNDWDAISACWRDRSLQWQIYCAQVLPWGDPRKAAALLSDMAQSPNQELRDTVMESLADLT